MIGPGAKRVVAFDLQEVRGLVEHCCDLGILKRHRPVPPFPATFKLVKAEDVDADLRQTTNLSQSSMISDVRSHRFRAPRDGAVNNIKPKLVVYGCPLGRRAADHRVVIWP